MGVQVLAGPCWTFELTARPAFSESHHIDEMKERIVELLRSDSIRWSALEIVESLRVRTACIGAGFLRNLVWDHLHGKRSDCRESDIDVLWFDPERTDPDEDRALERRLRARDPTFDWSVKNQARMHHRNGDTAYANIAGAMMRWPETATAIAARKTAEQIELIAPFGFDDLFDMVVRPTSNETHKLEAYRKRLAKKDWRSRWPQVSIVEAIGAHQS